MRPIKTLIPVTVVILLLCLGLSPAVSAEEFSSQDRTLEIGYKDAQGNTFYKKLVVTSEEYEVFNDRWTNWESFIEEIREDERMSIGELVAFETKTIELIQNIKEMTYDEETGTYLFPELDIIEFIKTYLLFKKARPFTRALAFGGSQIFTIGRGRAWLPFNRQGETFIGMRFLPIVIQHTIGYSKVKRVTIFPPSIGVEDRLFVHNLFTIGFAGLYINFGERYLDRPAGPVFLIGRTLSIRLGEDIP